MSLDDKSNISQGPDVPLRHPHVPWIFFLKMFVSPYFRKFINLEIVRWYFRREVST